MAPQLHTVSRPSTTTTTIPQCPEVLMTATTSPIASAIPAPLPVRVSQHVPLWLITDPHTPQEAAWLIIAWERRGDLLAAAVVPEDADMTTLETWPLYIQDTDLISTVPDAWAPQGPPVRWARTTDGFQEDGPLFWSITGWTWSGGALEPVTTLFDADDLQEKGLGLPIWSCKDTDGCWLEGYAQGWSWDAGQLTPECSLEDGESLDFWESLTRVTRAELEV